MAAKFTSESQKGKKKKKKNLKGGRAKDPKFCRQFPFGDTEKMHCAFS